MSVLVALQGAAPAITGTATWVQTQVWDAAAFEKFSVTGTWTQDQSWAATGSERFTGAATWLQTQSWEATASIPIPITGTGAWLQTQAWDANALEEFVASASFTQGADWAASAVQRVTPVPDVIGAPPFSHATNPVPVGTASHPQPRSN
jgi:hypothetical protein